MNYYHGEDRDVEKPQCNNCGSYKLKSGKHYFRGGIVMMILSLPWCVVLLGIPFLLAGAVAVQRGRKLGKRGYECSACEWEGIPTPRGAVSGHAS